MSESRQHWEVTAQEWLLEQQQLLWRRHSDAVNLELLRNWWPDTTVRRVLKTDLFDEAFGEGLYPFMEKKAGTVSGIDISTAVIDHVRNKYPGLDSTAADVRRLPFEDDEFDLIVSNSTLDHFHERDQIALAVAELYRVLRPGGEMVLTLDNLRNPVVALRHVLPFRLLNSLGLVPYLVGSTYGPGGVRKVVQEAGFSVIDTTFVMHCPRVLAVPIAARLQAKAGAHTKQRFLRWLMGFEKLGRLPTRSITGHFTAIRVTK